MSITVSASTSYRLADEWMRVYE